ncbi:MAG: hypothetical protein ACREJX_11210 [Polyangiaceae bacterium]
MAKAEGLDVVVRGLDRAVLEVREAAWRGVIDALHVAFVASYHLLSEDDHTLLELAAVGHPYSRTHGFAIHSPDEIVHVQTGEYRDALRQVSPEGSFGTIVEGKIVNDSELDRWIQTGTLRMRQRPWMDFIVRHFGNDMANAIIARVREAIRRRAA